MRARSIFDALREQVSKNGAWKSPSPQSEVPIINASLLGAQLDTSGIGQAWTTSRSSRTFSGGDVTPQDYTTASPAGVEDQLIAAGHQMNARAALPNRGVTPRTPLMRGR